MQKQLIYLLLALVFMSSCKDTGCRYFTGKENKSINISFQRFDRELNQINTSNIDKEKQVLNQKYPEFFEIYNRGIMRFGSYNTPYYNAHMLDFLNDSTYLEIYDTVQVHYPNLDIEEQELTKAFRRYNRIFTERQIPCCYTHISGFNTPLVVGDSILSISLDNYLGCDHEFYKRLRLYTYLLPNKNRQNIVSDAMRAWLVSEFPSNNKTLLDNMVAEGKIVFLLHLTLPEEAPHLILGLTPEQFSWLDQHELEVWKFAIENKHLFSTNQLTISKYLQAGPFFNFFGQGSSPMVGRYIGWHIVSDYMKSNKDVTIEELLQNTNGQKILEASGYKP